MNESGPSDRGTPATAPARAARPRKMPPVEQLRGRQLGRILIKMGKLRRSQVHEALEIQKEKRGPIGSILVELGHVSEEDLNLALGAQSGMEPVDLTKVDVPSEVVAVMTSQMAHTYRAIPFDLKVERNQLSLAMDLREDMLRGLSSRYRHYRPAES